jgi:hypothetical protein
MDGLHRMVESSRRRSGVADAESTVGSGNDRFVTAKVPAISEEVFKLKQVPQVRVSGADFPLVKKTTSLSVADGAPTKN